MHVCHTILVRGNHYQRKTMKDECSNVLIAVILGYLEFFIIFRTARNILFWPPQKGTQPTRYHRSMHTKVLTIIWSRPSSKKSEEIVVDL